MSFASAFESLGPRHWQPRRVAWAGGLLIAVIVGLSAYDIWRSYDAAIAGAGRELDSQARIIAEQTARSLQAVDVVLRHLAKQFDEGVLSSLSPEDLHGTLKDQAVGLVQIDGLVLIGPDGRLRGASYLAPGKARAVSVARTETFKTLSSTRHNGLYIDGARVSTVDGRWIYPLSRRLESPAGRFAGAVAARGRIDYFQDFYRDIMLEPGMRTALVHRNGTLLARYPPAPEALGKPLSGAARLLLSAHEASGGLPLRTTSPIDGADRIGVAKPVPDYPFVVVATRDSAAVLAPWRAQAIGTALRTLALSGFAALLIALLMRQFARLRSSEERFALAVSGSNDGIIDWDIVHDRMYSSPRAMQIVGIDSEATVRPRAQWTALVKYHPDDAARMKKDLDDFLEGRTDMRDGEYRVELADGSHRWIRHRNKAVRDAQGRPVRVAGSISDIDAQKRAEEALRSSEQQFRAVFDGTADGLVLRDADGRVIEANPAFTRITGYTRDEVLGKPWAFAGPQRAEWSRAMHRRVLEGESTIADIQSRRKDGTPIALEVRAVPIQHRGGPHTLAIARDFTAQKQAEAERARLEGQLLQAKKLEAIGTLAGGIAHDFNNILAAILGYGEMAQKHAPAGSALRRHLDAVVSAGMRAKSLVERILAFSRSGVGERMPVHVQSVVAEALDLVAASLPAHVRLERRLQAGDAAVTGDPTQIHQVVMNLCANAAQAMKSTGVLTVSLDVVERASFTAATSTLAAGRYVRLGVRDSGAGIQANVLERIFDPFFTTKGVGVGTGLGLSLVHGIVTDLGGGIDVESRPDEGALFTVYLPWSGTTTQRAVVEESIPAGNGETLLLVDDEEMLVRMGEEMAAELGYEPVGFSSSRAALEAFRAAPQRFHAVLTDEAMPELTGSELAREVRALRPDVPILLMSGVVTPALSARARELGAADVVPKPLAARELARRLAEALRKKERISA